MQDSGVGLSPLLLTLSFPYIPQELKDFSPRLLSLKPRPPLHKKKKKISIDFFRISYQMYV